MSQSPKSRRPKTLRIVTFNVFIGSPAPWFIYPLRSGSTRLQGSTRLERQIKQLKNLDADILCLQEMYCDDVFSRYHEEFSDEYEFAFSKERKPLGILTGEFVAFLLTIMVCTLMGVVWLVLELMFPSFVASAFSIILSATASSSSSSWNAAFIVNPLTIFCAVWLSIRIACRHTVLLSFFFGSVSGFMVTLWKKSLFADDAKSKTILFSAQEGDIENPFRPRAFQLVQLRHKGSNKTLRLLHVHTNALGPSEIRKEQVEEMLSYVPAVQSSSSQQQQQEQQDEEEEEEEEDFCFLLGDFNDHERSPAIQLVLDRNFTDAYVAHGGARANLSDKLNKSGMTWNNRNELARGWVRNPDFRCDYLFYRTKKEKKQSQPQQRRGGVLSAAASPSPSSSSPPPPPLRHARCEIVMASDPPTSDHYGLGLDFCVL